MPLEAWTNMHGSCGAYRKETDAATKIVLIDLCCFVQIDQPLATIPANTIVRFARHRS
jgi:hypothetical protein